MSPDCSFVSSGTRRPFDPRARCSGGRPRCGSSRRSRPASRPTGRVMTSPLGVKTKTSSCSRSIFRFAMNSPGSVVSCCQSTMRCSQADVLGVGASPCSPSGRRRRTRPAGASPGADLHLDRLALRPHHRRVQRLVQVELGHRDVVLEPPLHRRPHRVDRAERGVAVLHRVDDAPGCRRGRRSRRTPCRGRPSSRRWTRVLRPARDLGLDAAARPAAARTSSSTWAR